MWVLPTHKRPRKLVRFLNTFGDQDLLERVTLVLWNGDPYLNEYDKVFKELPKTWDVVVGTERLMGEKLNAMFRSNPTAPFYGILTDDILLATPNMLPELRREAESGKFTWPDDGVHGPRMSTHPVAPGRLIRALGYWGHPDLPQNGLDLVLYRVATALDILKYRGDLKLQVFHPMVNGMDDDETYHDAVDYNARAVDRIVQFEAQELKPLIESVRNRYGQKDHEVSQV